MTLRSMGYGPTDLSMTLYNWLNDNVVERSLIILERIHNQRIPVKNPSSHFSSKRSVNFFASTFESPATFPSPKLNPEKKKQKTKRTPFDYNLRSCQTSTLPGVDHARTNPGIGDSPRVLLPRLLLEQCWLSSTRKKWGETSFSAEAATLNSTVSFTSPEFSCFGEFRLLCGASWG